MELSINGLVPIPLRQRLENRPSDIWNQSLTLSSKEWVFIQAPSGTGKTTLIQMLYGIRDDFSGSVQWDAKSMKTAAEKMGKDDAGYKEWLATLRSQQLSIIFQDLRIFPQLTAWENLEVKRNLTNSVDVNTVLAWMERLGIADKKNNIGHTLSYGEQQRLVIIRALLQPFQWLLMDEPFSHLDHANTKLAAALIGEVAEQNEASILLADLDDNDNMPYTKKLVL